MSRPAYSHMSVPSNNAARDSLELASLASSSQSTRRDSDSSSTAGAPSSKQSFGIEDPLADSESRSSARPGRHNRSFSVSSAFDFASNLFPLSSTAAGYTTLGASTSGAFDPSADLSGLSLEKNKSLTFLNGLSLIIGLVIGSGIFSSPSQVNANAGSPAASLLVWLIAGILAWTGAASYAELGGAIPLNGGAQIYLSKIFGEWAGFLFTWCAVFVLKPGSAAIIAIIFGEYCVRAAVGADVFEVNPWINKGVALLGVSLVTLLNCISTKLGTRSADIFMFFKFIALLGVTVSGIIVAITGFSWKGRANDDWKSHGWFEDTSTDISKWAVALYAGLWAFDGWDNVNYVTGEFINPSRDLSRVIHTSMPLVILAYIFANLAYFFVLPLDVIERSNTVAVAFGHKIFGSVGSLVFAIIVSGSCFGALNATTFTSGRLVYAAGQEGYAPSIFGKIGFNGHRVVRLHSQGQQSPSRLLRLVADDAGLFFTPVNAMLLNGFLTAGYVAVGEFKTLLTFYGVAGYTFYFFTVLGLIVLRIKEPNLERPYRTWITTPIIFCCVSLFLLSRAVFAEPIQTIAVIGFVLIGLPVYFLLVARKSGRKRQEGNGWIFWKRWGRPS